MAKSFLSGGCCKVPSKLQKWLQRHGKMFFSALRLKYGCCSNKKGCSMTGHPFGDIQVAWISLSGC